MVITIVLGVAVHNNEIGITFDETGHRMAMDWTKVSARW